MMKNIRKKFCCSKESPGFTLIESLAAIFVLVIGISAIFQAFPSGVFVQKTAQMNTAANQLCQGKMEEIIAKSYDEMVIGVQEEAYGSMASFDPYKRRVEISLFDPNNPGTVPGSDLGVKKIKVTVYWLSHSGASERSFSVTNLFSKR